MPDQTFNVWYQACFKQAVRLFMTRAISNVIIRSFHAEVYFRDYPQVQRLLDEISARPAAARALSLKEKRVLKTEFDDEARRAMFPQNV
jgi:hypothetical protein